MRGCPRTQEPRASHFCSSVPVARTTSAHWQFFFFYQSLAKYYIFSIRLFFFGLPLHPPTAPAYRPPPRHTRTHTQTNTPPRPTFQCAAGRYEKTTGKKMKKEKCHVFPSPLAAHEDRGGSPKQNRLEKSRENTATEGICGAAETSTHEQQR